MLQRKWIPIASGFAVVSILTLSPLAAQQAGSKATQARIQKKTYDFKDAGKEMEYALFVPSAYDKEKKSPLIVALHGLGSNPQQIIRYKGLTDQAEKHGYIVVAPMGYNSRGWYGMRGPKGGKGKDDPPNLGELSEKDVMNVLGIVRKDYNVDPDRIYLAGHSMGGGGTVYLAAKYPDVWAALAPLAPALLRPMSDIEKFKHIPVMLIQGDKDNLCPVDTARRWTSKMNELKMTCEYVEIAGGDHVTVAWRKMPEIFEFFNKHRRAGNQER